MGLVVSPENWIKFSASANELADHFLLSSLLSNFISANSKFDFTFDSECILCNNSISLCVWCLIYDRKVFENFIFSSKRKDYVRWPWQRKKQQNHFFPFKLIRCNFYCTGFSSWQLLAFQHTDNEHISWPLCQFNILSLYSIIETTLCLKVHRINFADNEIFCGWNWKASSNLDSHAQQ